jgi:hypothetical protein
VELEIRGDECGGEFGVGGCASACTPDVGGDVVELFAILENGEQLVEELGEVESDLRAATLEYVPCQLQWDR